MKRVCAQCRAELPEDTPGNRCPRCLLELAVEDSQPHERKPVAQRFGDYELIQEIARGGMGVVYKARQRKLDRLVAVKMILAGEFASREQALRFRAEVEAAARLQHPNIVRIHETGEQDGQPYFSMDYVEGGNLTTIVRENPLPAKRAAAYVKTIADAIHYAHEQRILHRDLKPSNVLIDSNDQPRVTDFGLAKRMQKETFLTVTGEVMGSPSFMPPEQAGVKGIKAGRYSDVYSLGGILFYLVTGRPPFVAENVAQILHSVLSIEPVSPRLLNPGVPQDIATICLKCLEKEPVKRYQTAHQLAEELNRFLNDEPIHARPVGRAERAWRWCRRKPALAAATLVTFAAIVTALVFGIQAGRAEKHRMTEKRQNAIERALLTAWSGSFDETEAAIRQAELARASASEVRLLRGQLAFHRGDYAGAIEHLEQAAALTPQSVAAQAGLSLAYPRVGYWSKTEQALQTMERLSPVTFEDYLFKGLAQSDWDPERALVTLNEAVRRRPAGITRLFRARVRTEHAMQVGDLASGRAALADAEMAKELLPENVAALSISLKAHQVAAGIYQEAQQLESSASALIQAEQEAAALAAYSTNAEAIFARIRHFQSIGESGRALTELHRVTREIQNGHFDQLYALALYEHGEFEKAYAALRPNAHESERGDFVVGLLVAELTNGATRALQVFYESSDENRAGIFRLHSQGILRLLGRKREAVEVCLRLRAQSIPLPPYRNEWWRYLLDYNSDLLSAEDLLKFAGPSKWNQCEAHYFIGLTKLAGGDRTGSRVHFQKAMATRVFDFLEYELSRALLSRLNKDQTWPSWMPQ